MMGRPRIYVMPDAHVAPDASSGWPSEAMAIARNSLGKNEVLAEKTLPRVGFLLGFPAERGSHATKTDCPHQRRHRNRRLRRPHHFWRRIRRPARHRENGNHAKQAHRTEFVRRNLHR